MPALAISAQAARPLGAVLSNGGGSDRPIGNTRLPATSRSPVAASTVVVVNSCPPRRLPVSRRVARLAVGCREADEEPRLDVALALDRDRPARLAPELVREQLVCRARNLDPSRRPV